MNWDEWQNKTIIFFFYNFYWVIVGTIFFLFLWEDLDFMIHFPQLFKFNKIVGTKLTLLI